MNRSHSASPQKNTNKVAKQQATELWIKQATVARSSSYYEKCGKRLFDVCLATAAAVAVSPVVLASALAVKAETPGPVIFRQTRVGKGLSTFTIYKLRTMRHGNNSSGEVLSGNPDTTRVGRVLRRLKIDELPQIYNVLRGEMSVVGPRPFLPEMIEDLQDEGKYRFLVKPGLTGHAQTNGNIALSWPQRWHYDKVYVENMSFLFDIKILAKTLLVILFGEERLRTR